jgi:hypothetical protein
VVKVAHGGGSLGEDMACHCLGEILCKKGPLCPSPGPDLPA